MMGMYSPSLDHHKHKQDIHKRLSRRTASISSHYDKTDGLALLMPGRFAMDTVRTMKLAWPSFTPTMVVAVERDPDIAKELRDTLPDALRETYGQSPIVFIQCKDLSDVLRDWTFPAASYVDVDTCGLPNSYGKSYATPPYDSLASRLRDFSNCHLDDPFIMQGTFFRFGMRQGHVFSLTKNIFYSHSGFLFRQLYGESRTHERKLLRFAFSHWHTGRMQLVEPYERLYTAENEPVLYDSKSTICLPDKPNKAELTAASHTLSSRLRPAGA